MDFLSRVHRSPVARPDLTRPISAQKNTARQGGLQLVEKGTLEQRPPLGGGWHGLSRDWGRESKSYTYEKMFKISKHVLSLSQLC